jgi:molybdopterin-guanine dinucleotide biosynthesis protein A
MPSAAILAGGRASRFGGRDKGALVIGGRSIRERQIGELSRISDDILIVGGVSGASHGGMAREVADRVADAGPLGGLDAALAAARDERLVLLACDMPFVTADLLAHLLALAGDADAVVPRTERGYHPLCAAYTRACQPAVAQRLVDRRLTMVGLFEDVRVRVVAGEELEAFGDPSRLFANVNTPADYDALEAFLNHKL